MACSLFSHFGPGFTRPTAMMALSRSSAFRIWNDGLPEAFCIALPCAWSFRIVAASGVAISSSLQGLRYERVSAGSALDHGAVVAALAPVGRRVTGGIGVHHATRLMLGLWQRST